MAPTVKDGTDHAKSLFRGKGSQLPLEGQADLQETALGAGCGWGQGNPGGSGAISTGFQRRAKATLGAHWTQIPPFVRIPPGPHFPRNP